MRFNDFLDWLFGPPTAEGKAYAQAIRTPEGEEAWYREHAAGPVWLVGRHGRYSTYLQALKRANRARRRR